jgi:hypothetical protein
MAAPGTPNATVTPSFSSTHTAASIAFIFAMRVSFELEPTLGKPRCFRNARADHKIYSNQE